MQTFTDCILQSLAKTIPEARSYREVLQPQTESDTLQASKPHPHILMDLLSIMLLNLTQKYSPKAIKSPPNPKPSTLNPKP